MRPIPNGGFFNMMRDFEYTKEDFERIRKLIHLHACKNVIGVIFPSMGRDGALGMLAMKRSRAYNFVQDVKQKPFCCVNRNMTT